MATDFLNPESAQGLDLVLTKSIIPLHTISKYVHLSMIFFIVIGFFIVYLKYEKLHFHKKYIVFSLFALILCIGGIALPYFASSWNTTRLYQISLIFLAPFCVIGGIFTLNTIFRQKNDWELNFTQVSFPLLIFSALLAIFLLFNSGWLYAVAEDSDVYISFSSPADGPVFNEMEYTAALWIGNVTDGRSIFADDFRQLLFISLSGRTNIRPLLVYTNYTYDIGYTFVGTYNIRRGSFTNRNNQGLFLLEPFKQRLNTIYDNGGSQFIIN